MTEPTKAPSPGTPYPPMSRYALIGDCHTAALVSEDGAVDWCCLPRFDSGSCCGRLLDWQEGGYIAITPTAPDYQVERAYVDETLVLVTTFRDGGGEVRLYDFFSMHEGGRENPHRQLIRVLEGVSGTMELALHVEPRFDMGEIKPWIRRHSTPTGPAFTAVGGDTGLVIAGDPELAIRQDYRLDCKLEVSAGERSRLYVQFIHPEELDDGQPSVTDAQALDRRLEETIAWWRQWASKVRAPDALRDTILRSAVVLKALDYAPTGAVIAAPTTSLPADLQAARNWDYRYAWIRDATFTVDSLVALGCQSEADGLRRFMERSAAGSAQQLQVLYGVDGRRRHNEFELPHLEGYRGVGPVRVGNQAAEQLQLDIFGEVMELAWRWHVHGHSPEPDYWAFLMDIVEEAARRWEDPDQGLWEMRGEPRHFVHSKVMCWTALDRGIRIAGDSDLRAPVQRWQETRQAIRDAVESKGYDPERGTFVQAFGSREVDAALLLLPNVGFVDYNDPRMVGTVAAIRKDLHHHGLLRRYRASDSLEGRDNPFLACSFWLAECLARQHRNGEAREVFDAACRTASPLGLFAEQYDPQAREMRGNYPQGLTHLSHVSAALALARAEQNG
jgi:GH15 family glucan-1,4-alpha-glucosidase